jgi:hypothetical protein
MVRTWRWQRAAWTSLGVCSSLGLAFAACAQELEGLRGMTRPDDPLGVPSVGRILLVLLLMIAIAFAALYAVRKWQPKLESRFAGARSIKIVERTSVGGSQVYLLQVDGSRVLLTQYRGRITTLLLPNSAAESHVEPKQ